MSARVDELIGSLQLTPHPEGGYYREIWRAHLEVIPADDRGPRAALTTIYFLLPAGAVSRWHRVRSDEVWVHLEGAPLDLFQLQSGEWTLDQVRLGPLTAGHVPVHCVPAGWWQAARSTGDYTLVSCLVGPGFAFSDFELIADRPDLADQLRLVLPALSALV